MSAAATAPTLPPDDTPTPRGRLLGLVRRLIDYGRALAHKLQQHGAEAIGVPATHFGATLLPMILARITRGLQIAAMLETRLDSMSRQPTPSAIPLPRGARQTGPASAATPRPAVARARLPDLPTPEQIADLVRRKPVGAVLADICRDLGILPSHPLWAELRDAIIRYGGNFARLVKDILDRLFPLPVPAGNGQVRQFPPDVQSVATGPPA